MRLGTPREVSGEEPWCHIKGMLAFHGAWVSCSQSQAWYVLFGRRRRPLLLPVGRYAVQQACLSHFVGTRRATWLASTLLRASALRPLSGLLPQVCLHNGHPRLMPTPAFQGSAHVALQIGTPGPYQKASALYVREDGRPLALVKTAMTPSADLMVDAEAGWLEALAGVRALGGRVPRLLGAGETDEGRRYLSVSVAPSTQMEFAFARAHATFLAALGHARLDTVAFGDSLCARALRDKIDQLHEILPEGRRAVLGEAIEDCHARLDGYAGPMVVAHGDFAPWNTRIQGQELFVFDWEYAQEGANPLMDVLHYLLMPHAVQRWGVGQRHLTMALRCAQDFARETYPQWHWAARTVTALALAYFLEVLLHYAVASGRFETRDPVVASYWHLVHRRASWMSE